jgi:hypothetical protein
MNQATRDIAELLEIDLDEAKQVQDRIDEDWMLDWSECTTQEFQRAARICHTLVLADRANGLAMLHEQDAIRAERWIEGVMN